MIGRGRVIESDLYDISGRLRDMDPDYFLYYSYVQRRYEVHCRSQRGNTLAVAVPYPVPDERTLRLVRRTKRERAEKLFAEMEEENERLMRAEREKAIKEAESHAENLLLGRYR